MYSINWNILGPTEFNIGIGLLAELNLVGRVGLEPTTTGL